MSLLKSRWLRWTALVVVVLAVAVYVALRLLMPRHATPQEISTAMRTQARLDGPEKVYAATCAHCHEHQIAPVLRGRALPPAAITAIVRNGAGAMPAFLPSHISDAQLQDLAAYISQLPAATASGDPQGKRS